MLLEGTDGDAEGAPRGLIHQHCGHAQHPHAARIGQQDGNGHREPHRHQLYRGGSRLGVLGLLCGPQAAGQAGKALGAEDAAALGAGVLGGGGIQRGTLLLIQQDDHPLGQVVGVGDLPCRQAGVLTGHQQLDVLLLELFQPTGRIPPAHIPEHEHGMQTAGDGQIQDLQLAVFRVLGLILLVRQRHIFLFHVCAGADEEAVEKKGMIADRCEINRRVRADNRILRELKTQIKKLVQAVEKSIPVIAETLEAIRNHMIFTQYHLLHNEMQKEVIHDWMQHFRPILNKYDTIKKKLKAKVTEKKELNVQKSKTSILNPFQHIKLNQQLTTVTEEIEELKSAKEQLLFQAECSTEKDMASLSRKYDQMDKNLDILDSQDMALKEQLEKDAVAFQEEKLRPKPEQYTELLDARIQIRPTFREKLIEQLKGTFGEYYDYHYRDIATHEVDDLNMEDPYSFSHRTWELEYQRKQELQKKHPVQSRQKSHNTEL